MSDTSVVAIALFGLLAFFLTLTFIVGGTIAFIVIFVLRPTCLISVQPINTVPVNESSHRKCNSLNAAYDAINIAEEANKKAAIAVCLASKADDTSKEILNFLNKFTLVYAKKLSESNQIPTNNVIDQNQANATDAAVAVIQANVPNAPDAATAALAVIQANVPNAPDATAAALAVNQANVPNAPDAATAALAVNQANVPLLPL